jgi:NAD(P)-dependent dehydrogenase (short-subunit alcohol dehydrogenase family)
VDKAAEAVVADYGTVEGLINGAGGNSPMATTNPERSFFDIPADALQFVSNLNLLGTILPSQAFGRVMVRQKQGVILNISSMNAFRPLTRIPAYSAAKAAVSNFTQWLAVHLAQEYSPAIRVNAIAPGFFLTEQNRFSAHRQGNRRADRTGQQDHRTHAHGKIRRARGSGGRDLVAAFARLGSS